MPFTSAADTVAITAVKNAATFISLHTADPSTTGTNEVTGGSYARVAATWGTPAAGSVTATAPVVISIPAGTTITHWGLWTASTAGTFYFGGALAASEVYGAAGSYTLTPTLTAT